MTEDDCLVLYGLGGGTRQGIEQTEQDNDLQHITGPCIHLKKGVANKGKRGESGAKWNY
jgi:hypothetical protein